MYTETYTLHLTEKPTRDNSDHYTYEAYLFDPMCELYVPRSISKKREQLTMVIHYSGRPVEMCEDIYAKQVMPRPANADEIEFDFCRKGARNEDRYTPVDTTKWKSDIFVSQRLRWHALMSGKGRVRPNYKIYLQFL